MRVRLGSVALALGLATACGASQHPSAAATEPTAPAAQASAATAAAPAAAAPAPAPSAAPPDPELARYQALVDAPDRSSDDRALDAGRHPAQTLAFFGIAPGMRVAELAAGTGYTSELLARAVGPSGSVYAENPKFILTQFAESPWSVRLQKPVMGNVTRLDRELDDPFPANVHDLDAVLLVLVYHDTVWLKVDRDKMNRAIFAALKPGGIYGIVDHSSRPGAGLQDVKSLHRIDEQTLRAEVERAGFKLAAEGDFLRNPSDPRDWNASPRAAGARRGSSDRFVLKFVKP